MQICSALMAMGHWYWVRTFKCAAQNIGSILSWTVLRLKPKGRSWRVSNFFVRSLFYYRFFPTYWFLFWFVEYPSAFYYARDWTFEHWILSILSLGCSLSPLTPPTMRTLYIIFIGYIRAPEEFLPSHAWNIECSIPDANGCKSSHSIIVFTMS